MTNNKMISFEVRNGSQMIVLSNFSNQELIRLKYWGMSVHTFDGVEGRYIPLDNVSKYYNALEALYLEYGAGNIEIEDNAHIRYLIRNEDPTKSFREMLVNFINGFNIVRAAVPNEVAVVCEPPPLAEVVPPKALEESALAATQISAKPIQPQGQDTKSGISHKATLAGAVGLGLAAYGIYRNRSALELAGQTLSAVRRRFLNI